jgi:hypothetical protein
MTLYGTVGTLLATIPAMTLGTNVISPENPRVTAVKALPGIEIYRITDLREFYLSGVRIYSQARMQLTLAAATQAGLTTLTGQVNALLDNNRTDFIISIPLGYYREGHQDSPKTFWTQADWLIQY